MGIKKALEFILKGKLLNMHEQIRFNKAYLTFKCQVVYCPIEKKTRHINHPTQITNEEITNSFFGNLLDDNIAYKIAQCIINPITLQPFLKYEYETN